MEDEAGERVGVLWLGCVDGDAWVLDVEIDPAHRGRGLGRATMLLAEDEARRAGHARLSLNVFESNVVARSLYESLGYTEMARQMTKPL